LYCLSSKYVHFDAERRGLEVAFLNSHFGRRQQIE
jgi:hypothetical protein